MTEPHIAIAFGCHPDDLEIGAGGTLARLVEMNCDVHVVVLTDESDDDRARQRRTEALDASRALGVDAAKVHFCGLPDTSLSSVADGVAIKTVRDCVASIGAPDIVLCNTQHDSHSDHGAANRFVRGAFRGTVILQYPVVNHLEESGFHPRVFVNTVPHSLRKEAALQCHASQVQRIHFEAIATLEADFGQRIGVPRAEAFEVVEQASASRRSKTLLSKLNDCPFHAFWSEVLAVGESLYVLYATPVLARDAPVSSRSVNYDLSGIERLREAFSAYWYGPHPMKEFAAASTDVDALLDQNNVVIAGGATSNRLTDRYFNHFLGLRYTITHTMPKYRDVRVEDKISNSIRRANYGTGRFGERTIRSDIGLLSVLRNPVNPRVFVIGCMGVHSPGTLGSFFALADRGLLAELLELVQWPLSAQPDVVGFQVLIEQPLPANGEPGARILRDSLHWIQKSDGDRT